MAAPALRQPSCLCSDPRNTFGFDDVRESSPTINAIEQRRPPVQVGVCGLPPEIVLTICELSLYGVTSPLKWLRQVRDLRMVRRQWNDWILGSPFFWSVMYVSKEFCSSPPLSHAEALKTAKLDIVLDIQSFVDPHHPYLKSSSDYDKAASHIRAMLDPYRSIPWRSLVVALEVYPKSTDVFVQSLRLLDDVSVTQIQTLRLTNIYFDWSTHNLSSVETIELGTRRSCFFIISSHIAKMAASAPRLTHLVIHSAQNFSFDRPARPAHFPALRTLRISSTSKEYFDAMLIFRAIDAPELESLALGNVNLSDFVVGANDVPSADKPLYPRLRSLRIESRDDTADETLGSESPWPGFTLQYFAPGLRELVLVHPNMSALGALLAHITPPRGSQREDVQWPELRILGLSSTHPDLSSDESGVEVVDVLGAFLRARKAADAGVERIDVDGTWCEVVRPRVISWCESNLVECEDWKPGQYVQAPGYFDILI